jgi:hypothetical protein
VQKKNKPEFSDPQLGRGASAEEIRSEDAHSQSETAASVVRKDTSFLRSSASIVIPICVVSAALAVAIYRLLN